MNQPEPVDNSLTWLAFCYVADELPADERANFEARLATDQAAREAVAAAVELCGASQLVFAEAEQVVRAQPVTHGATTRSGWWSLALACGGLLALVVINQVVWRPAPTSSKRDLALAWSQTHAEFVAAEAADNNEGESLPLLDLSGDDEELDLPTWMIAAVSESTMNMNMTENPPADAIPE